MNFPYTTYQNPFMQIMSTPPVLQQTTSLSQIPGSTNIVGVNGIEGMKALQAGPNTKVVGFDLNEDIFYIKITDSANVSVIETYDFSKREEGSNSDEKFVTVKEFNKFKEDLLSGKQYIRKPKHNSGSASKPYKPDSRGYEHASEPIQRDGNYAQVASEISGSDGSDS